MSEMEMLKELRRIIAIVAGQDLAAERITGTVAHAKDQVREELVAMVREKFAGNLAQAPNWLGQARPGPAAPRCEPSLTKMSGGSRRRLCG